MRKNPKLAVYFDRQEEKMAGSDPSDCRINGIPDSQNDSWRGQMYLRKIIRQDTAEATTFSSEP